MDALDPLPAFDPLRSGNVHPSGIPEPQRVDRVPEEPEHERDREDELDSGEDALDYEQQASAQDWQEQSHPADGSDDDGEPEHHIDITV